MAECRYCQLEYQQSDRIALENDFFLASYDNHPVTKGHMKLVAKRHLNAFDQLTDQELVALRELLKKAKALIEKEFKPDGFNLGVNEGAAAGQTVFHLHVHLIPRYKGDVPDPTGGVRQVIPEKGNYLKPSQGKVKIFK